MWRPSKKSTLFRTSGICVKDRDELQKKTLYLSEQVDERRQIPHHAGDDFADPAGVSGGISDFRSRHYLADRFEEVGKAQAVPTGSLERGGLLFSYNPAMPAKQGRLLGRTALVTGAGRGIGRAVALAYAREGARLVLCSRTRGELEETAADAAGLGAEVMAQDCDVAESVQVKALVRQALRRFKRIDILVNNAGILSPRAEIVKVKQSDWENVLRVNLTGLFLITREVLLKSLARQGSGCVISVSSGVGRKAKAKWGPYGVSKFGVEGLMQTLAEEYRETKIRFYTLNPGPTRSKMRAEAYPEEDPNSLKGPEAVGEAFIKLAAGTCALPTGTAVDLDRATGRILFP